MRSLAELVRTGRTPRILGVDDAPFEHTAGNPVPMVGVICAGTRFEGLLWGQATVDGADATATLLDLVQGSKFLPQLHAVLLDGLAVGGFNLYDLPGLAAALERPVIAVMRRPPDVAAIDRALGTFPDAERRRALVAAAGPVHTHGPFAFQLAGAEPAEVGPALEVLTDRGHVPEALRLAHLIGSGVITGQSGRRA